jgi:hypothetical protein
MQQVQQTVGKAAPAFYVDIILAEKSEDIDSIIGKLHFEGYRYGSDFEALYGEEWKLIGIRCYKPYLAAEVLNKFC